MPRLAQLKNWLSTVHPECQYVLTPASSDASFRSYWRAQADNGTSFIVMDAPPEHENCTPFITYAELFRSVGVHTPRIHAQNLELGFLLLDDFGLQTYLDALAPFEGFIPFNTPALDLVRALFDDAIDALIHLQHAPTDTLAPYDDALLRRELELFPEWYAARHLNRPLTPEQRTIWEHSTQSLISAILRHTTVAVHRDFTVRNLMVTTTHNPGVLDFQDAVRGSVCYDILSLTRDAFLGMSDELVLDLVVRYWTRARNAGITVPETIDEFWRDFEWIGVQRHLKVAGIFARLNYRDGKTKYLAEIPRFIQYILKTCNRYEELRPLGTLVRDLAGIEQKTGYTF